MLKVFPQGQAIWVDLCNPTDAELAEAEALVGMRAPTREGLSEIESSSRLKVVDDVLSVSLPIAAPGPDGEPVHAPIGFLLSKDRLLTVRFAPLHSFDAVAVRFEGPSPPLSSLEVFVDLCEEIIDRLADTLEQTAVELRAISGATFRTRSGKGRRTPRTNPVLQEDLNEVGRLGDRLSDARDALLAIGRAVDFVCELTTEWLEGRFEPRLRSLRRDVASLDDYEVHLSDKVQFLLDAMVGLIGIMQNDIFKVLTIVSIVGIPPTLVAGIYGMNFKFMPEYSWALGYPYGLAVIALSAIIPLLWFKWRGWF